MADNNLSNQSRLNQNIRIASLAEFRNHIGGINGSPALVYDNYFASGLSNNPNVSKPLEGDEILNLILQSSAEGAYFTRDIINTFLTSDSEDEINLTFNKTEKAFKIYPAAGKIRSKYKLWTYDNVKIEDALHDVDVTFKKITN